MNPSVHVLIVVCTITLALSMCDNSTLPEIDEAAIDPPQVDTPDDPPPVDEPAEPTPDEPELWQPEPLHVYTFAADLPREQWGEDTARDVWQFSEDDYEDMLRRVEATIESHNRNHPDDELRVVGGGL